MMDSVSNITNKCPKLVEWSDWVILMCRNGNVMRIPDIAEMRSFCKSKTFVKCPYYIKSNKFTQTANI